MVNLPGSPWPEACTGAISLTFDDGSPSQLGIAVPILEECGLRGTFYLNPGGDDWRERLAPWRAVGERGHELGNHTMAHICSRALWGREDYHGLEDYTLEEVAADVDEAERRLGALVPGQTARSFCYPCYMSDVGSGLTRRSYIPLIAQRFPAARGQGELANYARYADLHYLASFPVSGWMSGADLVKYAQVAAEGRWVILTFHTFQHGPASGFVPGGPWHLPSMPEATFRELCAYLAEQRGRIWTAPLVEVAQRLSAWRQTTA
ncbi:MAG: polysaccharide deacetylase family protein [Anaerolineae bacterium]